VDLVIEHVDIDRRRSPMLRIAYAFYNSANEDVFLCNWLENRHGLVNAPPGIRWTTNLAYTLYRGDRTVLLFLGEYEYAFPNDWSIGVYPYALQRPASSLVPKGKTVRATITVPVPLVEWHAYASPRREPPYLQEVPIDSIELMMEYQLRSSTDGKDVHQVHPGAYSVPCACWLPTVQMKRVMVRFPAPEPISLLWQTDMARSIRDVSFARVPMEHRPQVLPPWIVNGTP
jgi:hypothetical protein